MNIHKNARTPNRRVLIVARLRAGETPRSIAGAVSIAGAGGVSRATVRKWKGRTLRADLLAGMGLRQTIQSLIRTGRRTVAFPPQL